MSVSHQKIDFQCPNCGSKLKRTLMSDHYCEECDEEIPEGELRR